MVVRVAPGQVRFVLPQLAVDARGVAQGRDLVVRFATLERLITFLRLITAEMALDELGAPPRIRFARAAHGSREVLLLVDQVPVHTNDAVLRAVRTSLGHAYTGTGRHFVAVRDVQSPLGYDVETLSSEPGDVVLYGHEKPTALSFEGELSMQQLLLRLELVRVRSGPDSLTTRKLPPVLYVTVRRGLGQALIEALHQASVPSWATLVEPEADASGHVEAPLWLVRIERAPDRLWGTLLRTPGITAFAPVSDNVLVARGYRHLVHLDACRAVFPSDHLFLFAPMPQGPRILSPMPKPVRIDDLVRSPAAGVLGRVAPVRQSSTGAAVDLRADLRLEHAPATAEGVVATLVPWAQVPWIKRLGASLPQPVLASYRIAPLTRGLLVVSAERLHSMPFGTLLTAAAKGVLVPLGYAIRPAVSAALLEEQFGTADGSFVVFPTPTDPPFRVSSSDLVSLQTHVLGQVVVPTERPTQTLEPMQSGPAPDIRYKSGVLMPLWGRK